jgi:hypothetical protein
MRSWYEWLVNGPALRRSVERNCGQERAELERLETALGDWVGLSVGNSAQAAPLVEPPVARYLHRAAQAGSWHGLRSGVLIGCVVGVLAPLVVVLLTTAVT